MNLPAASLEQPLQTPELACRAFVGALNAGQLDDATACFARDGCLITPDATAVSGRLSVRAVLAQLIARHVEIVVELSSSVTAGDVALSHQRWKIRSEGDGAAPFVQTSTPTLLLRRLEAEWKLAIAAPWGTGERALRVDGTSAMGGMA